MALINNKINKLIHLPQHCNNCILDLEGENNLKRKWIFIIVLVVLALGGTSTWYFMKDDTITQAALTTTKVSVEKGKLEVSVSGSGTTQAVSSTDIKGAEGVVDEVLVSLNEEVTIGEELVTFTDGSDPITAPHAGIITSLDVGEDDHISSTNVIAHVTYYKNLQTVITVDELDVSSIEVGQTTTISASAYPDEEFTGKVTSISREGTYENGVSTFEVTILIDDIKDLKVGMSVEATIVTESKEDALYLPIAAVQTKGDQKYVLVGQDSTNEETTDSTTTTKQVTVETGLTNTDYIEITSGLGEGDEVQVMRTESSSNNDSRGNMQGGFGGSGFGGSDGNMPSMPAGGRDGGNIPSGGAPGGGDQ